jgi:hypothetical protein
VAIGAHCLSCGKPFRIAAALLLSAAMFSTPAKDEAAPAAEKPGLLFDAPDLTLAVRLDFFKPNDAKAPDKTYFAGDVEKSHHFPWNEILLVDAHSGKSNAANNRIQIRARVRGLKALIEKSDPRADLFPVRIYRTFVNDLDDDESVYTSAFSKIFGSAPVDAAGIVREPDGKRIELKRIKDISGDEAVFISDILDIGADNELNPVKSALTPPTFAALDGDAWYTQYSQSIGDEEPDAWAFGQALKVLGFVSAGVSHPVSKRFGNSASPYQFSLSPLELLNIKNKDNDWEELTDAAAIEAVKKLPGLARVGNLKERVKNIGGSKLTGRPVSNGAFVVSTGVQKLVVTAMGSNRPGDTAWRFPGIVHATDGYMDQCLVRAPAQIFLFSGHGWAAHADDKAYPVFNCYAKDNFAAFCDRSFCFYVTPYSPGESFSQLEAVDENKIVLAEKWRKDEVRLQWFFLVGCEVLNRDFNPFKKWQSNAGTMGTLLFKQLNVKGIVGFSEHGFSSASMLKRYVERAATAGIAAEWMKVFRDSEANAYTWYETNETYSRSRRKSYADLQRIVPACVVRKANAADKLTPEALKSPVGNEEVEFSDLDNGLTKTTGVFGE